MSTIGIYASLAAFQLIGDKMALWGRWLQDATYDVIYLTWSEAPAESLQRLNLPYVKAVVTHSAIDTPTEMAKFIDALPYPMTSQQGKIAPPTLGEMLGYDDFPGSAMQWAVDGAGAFRPDLLLLPVPAAENISPQDSYVSMALSRFAFTHNVPVIQIEVSTARSPLQLSYWPCAALFTKEHPSAYTEHPAPLKIRMPATHRYVCSFGQDTLLDEIALAEPGLRKQLGPPGEHFLFLPSHLAFKQHTIELLAQLIPLVPELRTHHFRLLIGCTQAVYRKRRSEAEMLQHGLQQWLAPWGEAHGIVEGVQHTALAAIADAVLAPNDSHITECAARWGIPVLTRHDLSALTDLALSFPLADVVRYLLAPTEQHE